MQLDILDQTINSATKENDTETSLNKSKQLTDIDSTALRLQAEPKKKQKRPIQGISAAVQVNQQRYASATITADQQQHGSTTITTAQQQLGSTTVTTAQQQFGSTTVTTAQQQLGSTTVTTAQQQLGSTTVITSQQPLTIAVDQQPVASSALVNPSRCIRRRKQITSDHASKNNLKGKYINLYKTITDGMRLTDRHIDAAN